MHRLRPGCEFAVFIPGGPNSGRSNVCMFSSQENHNHGFFNIILAKYRAQSLHSSLNTHLPQKILLKKGLILSNYHNAINMNKQARVWKWNMVKYRLSLLFWERFLLLLFFCLTSCSQLIPLRQLTLATTLLCSIFYYLRVRRRPPVLAFLSPIEIILFDEIFECT